MQSAPASTHSYFATLRICVITSFSLLIAASAMRLHPWVAMLGGSAPLIYYHLGYLTPRAKKGLAQAAIDSVYYFGFLVTVAALAVSAVSLAVTDGKAPLNEIAFQFGLGLLATGYAVLARMHLTSISTWVEEASPEAVLDRYVQRSRELVTNVELASEQFVTLANNLMTKSEEVAKTAQTAAQTSMLEVARLFDEQLRGTLASARAGLTEVRGLMQDTAFVQEREELVRSVKESLECVTALNKALSDFSQRAGEGARISQEVTSSSVALQHSLSAFHANLQRIAGQDGPMLKAAQSVTEAHEVVVQGTQALGTVVDELEEMSGTVSGIGLTFKNIKTLTMKANEQLQGLAESSERLEGATVRIAKTADASGSLADNLERTAKALPSVNERLDQLSEHLDGLNTTVDAVEVGIKHLPHPVESLTKLGIEVTDALEKAARVLAAANAETKSLVGNTTEHAVALERARAAATDVAGLEAARAKLEEILHGLTGDVRNLQVGLNGATTSLRDAVSAATTALEVDVKRSSEVSRVFGERMTDIAQIIIDRTSESRPS